MLCNCGAKVTYMTVHLEHLSSLAPSSPSFFLHQLQHGSAVLILSSLSRTRQQGPTVSR